MAQINLRIETKLTWWLKPYLFGIAAMVFLTGREPNWDRVNGFIKRGVKARIAGGRWF